MHSDKMGFELSNTLTDDRVQHETGNRLDAMTKSNAADQRDMYRVGKQQELRRNFRSLTMFGFSMILMNTWEVVLSSSSTNLVDGGRAGVIWIYLIAWFTFIMVYASLAEMGSMAPTSGGQYRMLYQSISGIRTRR